jgi:hypothetical protein
MKAVTKRQASHMNMPWPADNFDKHIVKAGFSHQHYGAQRGSQYILKIRLKCLLCALPDSIVMYLPT